MGINEMRLTRHKVAMSHGERGLELECQGDRLGEEKGEGGEGESKGPLIEAEVRLWAEVGVWTIFPRGCQEESRRNGGSGAGRQRAVIGRPLVCFWAWGGF